MNKLFLLLLIPILAFGQATTGFHRVNQLLTRGTSGVTAQIVPYQVAVAKKDSSAA